MDVLIIGNGFDLAHGLETKYTDFLDYIRKEDSAKELREKISGDIIF
jgi:hypothetical protein